MRGLSTEGNLCFKIDRASHIVGRKFTIFALFCFIFGGNFQVSTSPLGGAHIRRDNLTEGCLHYEFGGLYLERLIHGGAYFRNFTVCNPTPPLPPPPAKRASSKVYIYLTFLFRLVLLQTYSSPYDTSICTEPLICHNLT